MKYIIYWKIEDVVSLYAIDDESDNIGDAECFANEKAIEEYQNYEGTFTVKSKQDIIDSLVQDEGMSQAEAEHASQDEYEEEIDNTISFGVFEYSEEKIQELIEQGYNESPL